MTRITASITSAKYYQSIMETAIQSSCCTCEFRSDGLFCDMSAESLQAFDRIKSLAIYPRNAILFAEGRPVRGVYVLCEGRAKLSICSEGGRRMTLRIAGPGAVLGLGATLSNSPYEITAELLDQGRVVFVRRRDLVKFLRDHPQACMQIVRLLSQDLHGAYERVRAIGMLRSHRPPVMPRPRAMVV